MYAKIINNIVEKYPFNIRDLQIEFPNTSFPLQMTDEALQEFGIYKVNVEAQPLFNERTQYIELSTTPSFANGVAKLNWNIVDKTNDELLQDNIDMAKSVRAERNRRIAQLDWTQGKDIPDNVSVPAALVRQALRDVPLQSGFPWNIDWPQTP